MFWCFFNQFHSIFLKKGMKRIINNVENVPQITECYAFLPREAVTKFLTQCSECRKSMKSTSVQDISEVEQSFQSAKVESDGTSNHQHSLSKTDYPKNIESYMVLLKALYENSSLLNHIKGIDGRSCERQFESFKENIIANQTDNNGNSNQQQQNIQRKGIKSESDNLIKDSFKTVGGERNLGNIIINSLDVSINVAGKTSSYDNIDIAGRRAVPPPLASPESQQLVTSSSSEPGDEEDCFNKSRSINTLPAIATENNNLASHNNSNEGPARAVYSTGVDDAKTLPDDTSFDYHNVKCSDDNDKHTTSTTCNNNSTKHSDSADVDVGDYHTKCSASIDRTEKCNKQNNSAASGDIRPITSTYLLMTRSMGLTDEDALNLVSGKASSFG